ncbi:MAG: VWA domain-containing protein, partial [Dehalococcoidia bacterium]
MIPSPGAVDFAMPLALLALALVPLLALAVRYEARRRSDADQRYGGPAALRPGRSALLRGLRAGLLLAAVALLIVAVARPRWGSEPTPITQRGIDVVIVLDVSRSMLATDIAPSRAEATAEGVADMLTHMTGNRVGLVTFAGSAFERSPLTLDLGAVATLVERAQPESVLVRPGTDLRLALETALGVLDAEQDADRGQAIVLISDGEDIGGDIDSALQRAADRDVRIYSVFAATEEPTALPESSGGTDTTQGDRSTLARLAEAGGGEVRDLSTIAGLAVEFRRLRQIEFDSATQDARIERFPWFLGAAVALLLLHEVTPAGVGRGRRRRERRRLAPTAAASALLLLAGCAGTLAYQHVEAGNRQHAAGEYAAALAEYRAASEAAPEERAVDFNIANTLHELGRFNESLGTATAALDGLEDPDLASDLRYTVGSSAYAHSDLQDARAAFEDVLRTDPADLDAKANLELVLRALQPQEPPPEATPTPEPGSDSAPPGEGAGEEPGEEPGEPAEQPGQEPGEPGDQPGEPGEGEPGESGEPGDPAPPGAGSPGGSTLSPEEAQAALDAALAEL